MTSNYIYKVLKEVISTTNATSEVLSGRRQKKIEIKEYAEVNKTALQLLRPDFLELLLDIPELKARRKIGSLLEQLEKELASRKIKKQLQNFKHREFIGLALLIKDTETGETIPVDKNSDFLQVPKKTSAGMKYYCAFIGLLSVIKSRNSALQLCDLLTEFYSNLSNGMDCRGSRHLKFPERGDILQRELRRFNGNRELRALWIQLRHIRLDREIHAANEILSKSSSRKRPKKS